MAVGVTEGGPPASREPKKSPITSRATSIRVMSLSIRFHIVPEASNTMTVARSEAKARPAMIEKPAARPPVEPKILGAVCVNTAWWTVTFPGIAITLFVMGASFLGDTLRDLLDPHTR